MKNTKIMAVLVVLLAAMLFVGAASATEYTPVKSGDSAFVYESINLTNSASNVLTKFSEGSNPTAVNTIYADNNAGNFSLYASSVNGQYGTYYATSTWQSDMSGVFNISIWYPEISLKGELTTGGWGVTSGDSIDGKTINKNTNVTFLIDTPMVGPANSSTTDRFVTNDNNLSVKIVFTTPVGGKTTNFGYDGDNIGSFANIGVTKSQNVAGSVTPGIDATAGTYTAQAEFINYKPFADNAEKSNTISFTVQSTSLSLTVDKDSVVRSNPFTVTIQGDSDKVYFVYIEGSDKNQPYLIKGQSGYQADAGTYVNSTTEVPYPVYSGENDGSTVPLSPAINDNKVSVGGNDYYSYGYFKTDASGNRVIQYNTQDNTDDKTYTIRVISLGSKITDGWLKGDDYDTAKVKVEKGSVTISASGDGSYYLGDEITLSGTNSDSPYVFLFITGPNLDYADGVILKNLPDQVPAYNATNPIDVKTDNTWEYKWDTSNIALDTGAYTIYATSKLKSIRCNSA